MISAHLFQEHFAEAALWARRALADSPNFMAALRCLAAALAHLGQMDEARVVIERLLVLAPTETVTSYVTRVPFCLPRHVALFLEGLRRAGYPE